MAKKIILYPVVKETTYYSDKYYQEDLRGKPDKVKGSLLTYEGDTYYYKDNFEMIENKVFEETLTFSGYGRGRSSAVFYWKDSTGADYQMFMTDMDDLLNNKNIINRQVTGAWTFCKRGQNYEIKLAD
jgi:hypothetical protein